jgi:hypothetical protein
MMESNIVRASEITVLALLFLLLGATFALISIIFHS